MRGVDDRSAFTVRTHHDDYILDRNDPAFRENLHDTTGITAAAGTRSGEETSRSAAREAR